MTRRTWLRPVLASGRREGAAALIDACLATGAVLDLSLGASLWGNLIDGRKCDVAASVPVPPFSTRWETEAAIVQFLSAVNRPLLDRLFLVRTDTTDDGALVSAVESARASGLVRVVGVWFIGESDPRTATCMSRLAVDLVGSDDVPGLRSFRPDRARTFVASCKIGDPIPEHGTEPMYEVRSVQDVRKACGVPQNA